MDRSSTGPARQGGLERPEGSEQVWVCPKCHSCVMHAGTCDRNGYSFERVPYLPASRVEALEGRIGELTEALERVIGAKQHGLRYGDTFPEICDSMIHIARRALAPAEAVEEEK